MSTHQPAGKRALCAKYSTHTKTFQSPPEIGTFPIYLGYSKHTYIIASELHRHGMTQCNSFNIFNETLFTIELILLESSPVFVLLQDFVLLQRQKLP